MSQPQRIPGSSPHSGTGATRSRSVLKHKETGKPKDPSRNKEGTPAPNNMLKQINKDELKQVKSHTELAQTANGVRMLTKNLGKANIQLHAKAVMIVTKARDNSLVYLTREVAEFLLNRQDDILIFVDYKLRELSRFDVAKITQTNPKANKLLKFWTKAMIRQNPEMFDLCITLGGDGTVLHVLTLFQSIVPPVISFALGSLGFLTNFRFEQFRKRLTSVLDSGVRAYMRMRFTCRVYNADHKLLREQQVLNELVVDRGPSPYVTNLELYGDGALLTVAQADGLIIATPTGSTAYSLSAGGSLVHPQVSAISVTPICPHTLSFRPILLPDGMTLKVKVPITSRAKAWASFDGKTRHLIEKGFYVTVQASPFPFPTVRSSKNEYMDSISRNLNWNAREQQKPFTQYLTGHNKSAFEKKHNITDFDDNLAGLGLDDDFDIDYSDDEEDSTPSEEFNLASFDRTEVRSSIPFYTAPDSLSITPSSSFIDNRTCFAHPNATVLMNEDPMNSSDALDRVDKGFFNFD